MFSWVIENFGTIAVCLALTGIVMAIVVTMVRSKKKGGSSCGCSCGGCPMSGECHHSMGKVSL